MESLNKDGFGYAYVKDNQFRIQKWPFSLTKVLKKNDGVLSHLDSHDGWTIIHLRAASHGKNKLENTHPWIINDEFAWHHNGVWHEYSIAKAFLEQDNTIIGETDSEIAALFYKKFGLERFLEEVTTSGVFMALNKDGKLNVIKTSGDLVSLKRNKTWVLSSELSYAKYDFNELGCGWYIFNADGTLNSKKAERPSKTNLYPYYNYNYMNPSQYRPIHNIKQSLPFNAPLLNNNQENEFERAYEFFQR